MTRKKWMAVRIANKLLKARCEQTGNGSDIYPIYISMAFFFFEGRNMVLSSW